jgi:hypothetical protein
VPDVPELERDWTCNASTSRVKERLNIPKLKVDAGQADALVTETVIRMQADAARDESLPEDPIDFVTEVLGDDPWEDQIRILRSVQKNARTSVAKCHSSGGTRAAAYAVHWWLHRYTDAVVYTLAPTWSQVHDLLWKDVEDLYQNAKVPLGGEFRPKSCRWEFGPRRYAIGRSTDRPERLQGPHGGHFLLIIDEASGFPEELEAAVEGMLASGEVRLLMLSQPTQLSGMFYRSHHSERSSYKTFSTSAYDTPNLRAPEDAPPPRPYLVRREWVEARRKRWGVKSPLFQIRVLGKFPKSASDSLMDLDSCEAMKNIAWNEDETEGLGVDIARFGNDFTAYTHMRGNEIVKQWRRQGKDLMETAGEIKALHEKNENMTIVVDDTGLGGGVTDRLREQNVEVVAVNFGSSAIRLDEDVANRGSELWWELSEDVRDGKIRIGEGMLPEDVEELLAQLLQPVYTFTSNGRIKVMKLGVDGKEQSPDLGDSLALAWEGVKAADRFTGATGELPPATGGEHEDRRGVLFGIGDPSNRGRMFDDQ